jgi:hypothetical protein
MKRVTIYLDGAPLVMDYQENVEPNLIEFIESAMNGAPPGRAIWTGTNNVGSERIVLMAGRVYGYRLWDVPPPLPNPSDKILKALENLSQGPDEDWKKS